MLKTFLFTVLFVAVGVSYGQESTASRSAADGPFVPEAALPGGIVMPLYPADSPLLQQDRIHEAERYNTAGGGGSKLLNTLNIHNPTIEVHLAEDRQRCGTGVIVAPGGGHKILWVGPEGYELTRKRDPHDNATAVHSSSPKISSDSVARHPDNDSC